MSNFSPDAKKEIFTADTRKNKKSQKSMLAFTLFTAGPNWFPMFSRHLDVMIAEKVPRDML